MADKLAVTVPVCESAPHRTGVRRGTPVSEVAERKWRVFATGPVRSIGEYEFKDWKIDGKSIDMVSRFTQWAGEHGFHHRVTLMGNPSDSAGLQLAAALPKKPGIDPLTTSLGRNMLAVVRSEEHTSE